MNNVAQRYAEALFELASEKNKIDLWQEQMDVVGESIGSITSKSPNFIKRIPCNFCTLFLPDPFRFHNMGKSFSASMVYLRIQDASAPSQLPIEGSTQPPEGGFHPSTRQDILRGGAYRCRREKM